MISTQKEKHNDSDPRYILELSRSILLVDWPNTRVPRALLEAGLSVFGYSPNHFSRAELVPSPQAGDSISVFPPQNELEHGFLVFHRLASRPQPVNIVCVYRPPAELLHIITDIALPVGAAVLWLPRPVSANESALVAEHRLKLVENCDIVEVASSLRKQSLQPGSGPLS
jgi:predicted CoA-binding protein